MEAAVAPMARAEASSAATSARRLVTRSAEPSTATTTSEVPRKIRVPSGRVIASRPARGSVAPALLGIRLAVFVEMGCELEAAGVELERQLLHAFGRHRERSGNLGSPLVPGVER